jgi:hypothetical protein
MASLCPISTSILPIHCVGGKDRLWMRGSSRTQLLQISIFLQANIYLQMWQVMVLVRSCSSHTTVLDSTILQIGDEQPFGSYIFAYLQVLYGLGSLSLHSPQKKEELFNLHHTSARNIIEQILFGILKACFKVLRFTPKFSLEVQSKIPQHCVQSTMTYAPVIILQPATLMRMMNSLMRSQGMTVAAVVMLLDENTEPELLNATYGGAKLRHLMTGTTVPMMITITRNLYIVLRHDSTSYISSDTYNGRSINCQTLCY